MSMPTKHKFSELCKTFHSLDYLMVARTYYNNSDKFLSIKDVSMLSGVKPSAVRYAKKEMNRKGVCFSYIGTCNDRRSKMCDMIEGKGYNISAKELDDRKALGIESTLKMNSKPRKISYNKSIVNSTLNSVFN